jgi:hypothetical protein
MFAFSSCRRVLLVLTLMLAPALAQTSSTLLKGDQAAAYEQLKQTFQALPPFNSAMSSSALYDSVNPNTYNLANCQDGSEFLAYGTHRDVVLDRLADLALQIILWSTDLRTLGYPEQVWRPLLSNFEQAQLRLIQNVGPAATEASYETIRHPYQTFAPRFAESLNAYRRQNPRLRPIIYESGCGAGEISVHIQTQPPIGNVDIIPRFFYKLCQVQKLDAENPRTCDHWREVGRGAVDEVAGSYFYRIRWPDGAIDRGTLDFSKTEDGGTITLPRQR